MGRRPHLFLLFRVLPRRKRINAMPFIPVPNTALAEIRMLVDSQKVENTLYFLYDLPPNAADLNSLGEALVNWWVTNMAPLTPETTILREVVCTDISSESGPQVTNTPAADGFGTMATETLPSNCSFTISLRTALRGRSFRGRNYVVGLGISQVVGNNLVSGYADAFVDAYTLLIGIAEALSSTWVVASRFSGVDPDTKKPIPRIAGVTTPITTVLYVDLVIDSQRRRLPGRGE